MIDMRAFHCVLNADLHVSNLYLLLCCRRRRRYLNFISHNSQAEMPPRQLKSSLTKSENMRWTNSPCMCYFEAVNIALASIIVFSIADPH